MQKFSNSTKIASVRPIFKEGERTEIGNYRSAGILNCFSKIYERFLHNLESFLDFISSDRKRYSRCPVLIRLNENWKETLDKNILAGLVFMDLSKI